VYSHRNGQVAEWLKAHAWKVCNGESRSRVRIPPCPPNTKGPVGPFGIWRTGIGENPLFDKIAGRRFWACGAAARSERSEDGRHAQACFPQSLGDRGPVGTPPVSVAISKLATSFNLQGSCRLLRCNLAAPHGLQRFLRMRR
jgi:hypothetical protein